MPGRLPRGAPERRLLALGGLLVLAHLGTSLADLRERAPPAPAESLTGSLLVAAPTMEDPRFAGTVLYVVQHDAGGAMAVVVNRPVKEVSLGELMGPRTLEPTSALHRVMLHFGGPVSEGQLFVLHSPDFSGARTVRIEGGLAMTTSPDVLAAIGEGRGPQQAIVAAGHAGWAPGQLEGELDRGGWAVLPDEPSLVFAADAERTWERALRRAGERLLDRPSPAGGEAR